MPVCATAGALCVGWTMPALEPHQPKDPGQCFLLQVYLVGFWWDTYCKMYWGTKEAEPLSALEGSNTYALLCVSQSFAEKSIFFSYRIFWFVNFSLFFLFFFFNEGKYFLERFSKEQMWFFLKTFWWQMLDPCYHKILFSMKGIKIVNYFFF